MENGSHESGYQQKLNYLNTYQWRKIEVDALKVRMEHMAEKIGALEDKLTGISAQQITDMPKGGKPRGMGDLIAVMLDLKDALEKNRVNYEQDLKEAEIQRTNVYNYIRSADSIRDRTILAMHYVDGMSYARIAEVMSYSDRQIKRICKNAVKNLNFPPACP